MHARIVVRDLRRHFVGALWLFDRLDLPFCHALQRGRQQVRAILRQTLEQMRASSCVIFAATS